MLKKKLIMKLILTAIMISMIIPTTVFGVRVDFYPRSESYWTGSIQIGANTNKFDGSILVGFTARDWPDDDYIFRGFATFDIGALPANACVERVVLEGYCIGVGGPAHGLEIRRLTAFSPLATATTLSNAIKDGLEYGSASTGMRTGGVNSRILSTQAWADLETAAQSSSLKWFAVGLTEKDENTKTGLWDGWSGLHPPYLSVTYSVPVQTAPTVSIDTYLPCANDPFKLSWASISGVDGYELKRGNGSWTITGSGTSVTISEPTAGNYTYYIRGVNSCSVGPASTATIIEIVNVPTAPASVTTANYSQCLTSRYTIYWDAVVGADSYQVRENDGNWINTGANNWYIFSHLSTGTFTYSARAINSCGDGQVATSPEVFVQDNPPAPAVPIASNAAPCPDGEITISWPSIPGVIIYELRDMLAGGWVYYADGTSWTTSLSAGSYEYRLKVFNNCGWSLYSEPLYINTKQLLATPEAPVAHPNPAVAGDAFTIAWDAVDGATSYDLYEVVRGRTNLLYSGPELKMKIKGRPTGVYYFAVKICDDCGCSDMSEELALTVDKETDVEEIDAPVLPNSFALGQNYPNPFNPETKIEFSLARSGFVKLTIYNILGDQIRTLVNDQLSAGYKSVIWNGLDNSGRQVSSGTYLYKLTAGDYTETKKMMLLK